MDDQHADSNGEIRIEKGIPIPPGGRAGKENARYPFADMEVGDSFFVAVEREVLRKRRNVLSSASNYWKKRGKGQFTIRAVDGGLRVWRTA